MQEAAHLLGAARDMATSDQAAGEPGGDSLDSKQIVKTPQGAIATAECAMGPVIALALLQEHLWAVVSPPRSHALSSRSSTLAPQQWESVPVSVPQAVTAALIPVAASSVGALCGRTGPARAARAMCKASRSWVAQTLRESVSLSSGAQTVQV